MEIRQLLPHLYYFWSVVKSKSFSKTAEEFNISTAAVGYQIRSLEEKLNILLLKRETGQRPELTEMGEQFAKECHEVFTYIEKVFADKDNDNPVHYLNITAPLSFGSCMLMPAQDYLRNNIPGIHCNLELTDTMLEINHEVDIAIRNTVPVGNYEIEPLMGVRYVAIASNKYLETMPSLNSLSDLRHHKIICSTPGCQYWLKLKTIYPEIELPSSKNILSITNNISIVEAVTAGMGIALLPDYVVINVDHSQKDIKAVLTEYLGDNHGQVIDHLYLCYSKLNINEPLIAEFTQHFKEYLHNKGKLVHNSLST